MELLKKNIRESEIILNIVCEKIGLELFQSYNEKTQNEHFTRYAELKNTNEIIKQAIFTIADLHAQEKKLNETLSEYKKNNSELEQKIKNSFTELGLSLVEHYKPEYNDFFGTVYTKALALKTKNNDLELASNDEKKSKNFFSQIIKDISLVTEKQKNKIQQNQYETIVSAGAKKAFTNNTLKVVSLDEKSNAIYKTIKDFFAQQEEINIKINEVTADKHTIKSRLAHVKNDVVPSNVSSILRKYIEKNAREQKKLVLIEGSRYIDDYLDPKGEMIQNPPKQFLENVLQAQEQRQRIESARRQLRIIELRKKISSETKNRDRQMHLIQKNEQKIVDLQEAIKNSHKENKLIAKTISELEAEISTLVLLEKKINQ